MAAPLKMRSFVVIQFCGATEEHQTTRIGRETGSEVRKISKLYGAL